MKEKALSLESGAASSSYRFALLVEMPASASCSCLLFPVVGRVDFGFDPPLLFSSSRLILPI
jgi:hypothetical protein